VSWVKFLNKSQTYNLKKVFEMSLEKISNLVLSFFLFIVIILVLGAIFPQWFGIAAQILTENLQALVVLLFLAIIIYIIANIWKER
jgi:hypothetical protein